MRPVEGRQVEVYMLRGTTQNRLNFTVEMHNESKSNIFLKSTVNNYYFNSTKTPRENAKIVFTVQKAGNVNEHQMAGR